MLLEIEGFLLLEIEGFLLLEIGADFSYWKLMRARLTSNQERSVVLLRVHLPRFGSPRISVNDVVDGGEEVEP